MEANWDIGEYTLTSITAVKSWNFDNNIDVDGTANTIAITNVANTTGLPVLDINGSEMAIKQYSQEIRLQSPIGEKFDYVVGLYGFKFDLDNRFDRRYGFIFPFQVFPGFIVDLPLFASGSAYTAVRTRNIAAFGQANYHINEKLDFIFGGRVLNERLEYSEFSDLNSAFIEGDLELYRTPLDTRNDAPVVSETAATYKLGFAYEVNDTLNTYATFTTGYKARASQSTPSTDLLTGITTVTVNTVDPEKSDAFELGVKFLSDNKRFQMNVALFYTEYKGLQLQIFDPSANSVLLANVGLATTKGVEVDFMARPIEGLTLSGGFAYIDATIDELDGQLCYPGQKVSEGCDIGSNSQSISNADLPNSPDLKINLAARYDTELSDSGLHGFVQMTYSWQDDTQFVLGGDDATVVDSYGIANASMGITSPDGTYKFTVYAKNLFDKRYETALLHDFLVPGLVNQFVPRDAERYFGASLRVSF